MKTFICKVCGHIAFDQAPVACPVCGMAIENFENDDKAITIPADPDNPNEMEKKHIPSVRIGRECGVIAGGECTDVHIKVGEIEHVMESEHFIEFIDIYIEKRYMSRVMFTPKRSFPAADLHLKIYPGKLRVIAHCNVHGSWMTKVNLNEK